jgi:chemotaxis methyl-accepting protein methylase
VTTAARLLGERYGLRVDGSTRARLERLLVLAESRTERDRAGYEALLARDADELEWLMQRLTVQETEFFRHAPQFELVAERVRSGGGVVWSAGCANGQEAWSLAMLLDELGARGWSVLATDISADALARARAGRYAGRELRGLSAVRRARHLRQVGDDEWEVGPGLRSRVRFARHNVATDSPPPDVDGRVVLCRNVLIYLRRSAADRFLARLRDRMPADGVLVLGTAEALPADHPSFSARRVTSGYVYEPRREEAAEPAVPAPAQARPAERSRPPRGRPQRPHRAPEPLPTAQELLAAGESHAAAGRHRDAAVAFRKAVYLDPDDGVAHARLGFALEAAGDARAAARAFRAAQLALGTGAQQADLGGWSVEELRRVVGERAALLGSAP